MSPAIPPSHRGEPPSKPSLYAPARAIANPDDCWFYHTIDLPGVGTREGLWDLRNNVDAYLGCVPVAGKRVLEVGTANGFLCFEMEKRGAEVVAYDLSDQHDWDIVPYANVDVNQNQILRKNHIRQLNNAFWLGHRAVRSSARMVYGHAYAIPEDLGPVDVVTYGSILLHLRDPFLALANGARLSRETVVVTEPLQDCVLAARPRERPPFLRRVLHRVGLWRLSPEPIRTTMTFLPDGLAGVPLETWWALTPEVISAFLHVLGFHDTRVCYHTQRHEMEKRDCPMFTVVGTRTAGAAVGRRSAA